MARTMHGFERMTPFRILRRPDGVIELRRRRLCDGDLVRDAAVLVAMFLGCVFFLAALVASLVATPLAVAVAAAFVFPGVFACTLVRVGSLAAAVSPPRREA
jgi:hypothetical protein